VSIADTSHGEIPALLNVMRKYSYAYTASHDFSVCASIMVDDYELRMGPHRVVGRDGAYRSATQRQYDQFPGLGFTVHDLMTNGDRVALRFSEHGRSVYRDADSVWEGISMYRWDGSRLLSCWVEQDYFARRRQLESGQPNPVEPPGMDPWSVTSSASNLTNEARVRAWLEQGGLDDSPIGTFDDEWCASPARARLNDRETLIDDIFSAGNRVAFHVTETGAAVGDSFGLPSQEGAIVTRYASGIAVVSDENISARVISDRLSIAKELAPR
jgi:predicted ester cyclase